MKKMMIVALMLVIGAAKVPASPAFESYDAAEVSAMSNGVAAAVTVLVFGCITLEIVGSWERKRRQLDRPVATRSVARAELPDQLLFSKSFL